MIVNRKGVALIDTNAQRVRRDELRLPARDRLRAARQRRLGHPRLADAPHALLYVAVPVAANGRVDGAVRITYPTSAVDSRIRRYWLVLAAIAAIVLAVAVVVGLAVATFIARPLRRLEARRSAVGAGDLTARAPEHEGPPEVRSLAAVFNETVAKLDQLLRSQDEFVADASHQLQDAADRPAAAAREPRARRRARRDARSSTARSRRSRGSDRSSKRCSRSRAPTRAASPPAGRRRPRRARARRRLVALSPTSAGSPDRRSAQPPRRPAPRRSACAQVLDNLLENALEVSPQGGTITVETRSAPPWIELRISDEGPGLAREERERAFDRFWRNRSGEGSGLGLAIVRRLVEQDGGKRRAARRAGPRARGGRPAPAGLTRPGIFAPRGGTFAVAWPALGSRPRTHMGMAEQQNQQSKQSHRQSRRAAFVLAAVLAATSLTGGAAVTGLTRHAPASGATQVVQQAPVVQQQPAPAGLGGDD